MEEFYDENGVVHYFKDDVIEYHEVASERSDIILPNKYTYRISNLITISAIIWVFIAIVQIVIGIPLSIFGIGVATLCCGVWNIWACIKNFKFAQTVKKCDSTATAESIVAGFDQSKTMCIVVLVLNFLLGGGFGVVGAIYDLCLRSYVLKNADKLGVSRN